VYRTLELLKRLRLIDELDLMHLNGEKHFFEAKTTVEIGRTGMIFSNSARKCGGVAPRQPRIEDGLRCRHARQSKRKRRPQTVLSNILTFKCFLPKLTTDKRHLRFSNMASTFCASSSGLNGFWI
jgi:hypothetical protein